MVESPPHLGAVHCSPSPRSAQHSGAYCRIMQTEPHVGGEPARLILDTIRSFGQTHVIDSLWDY